MTDREQLLELRDDLSRQIGFDSARFRGKSAEYVLRLIDRLLARLPYEVGEEIEVSHFSDFRTKTTLRFLSSAPNNTGCVVCYDEGVSLSLWPCHRPIPRTRTLEVPEEIIEAAKKGVGEQHKTANSDWMRSRDKVCEWLAREAGKG